MHIRKIELSNFMRHDHTVVTFPERGIVLIDGPNGAGKSSLTEAVSQAFWGKSLRGTPPWRRDTAGSITVLADRVQATRSRTPAGSPKLKWAPLSGSESNSDAASTTKAQENLEGEIGGWDRWCKTHLFSSQDAAHFTLATDSTRKKLLEEFLGSDRFDPALKQCRADLRQARTTFAATNTSHAVLVERLAGAKQRLQDLRDTRIPDPVVVPEYDENKVKARITKLSALLGDCSAERSALTTQLRKADNAVAEAKARMRVALRDAELVKNDRCPVCRQSIPANLVTHLKSNCTAAQSAVDAAVQTADATKQDLQLEIMDLEEDYAGLRSESEELGVMVRTALHAASNNSKLEQERIRIKTNIEVLAQKIENAEKELLDQAEELVDISTEILVLEAVERALGLEGIRAQILGQALAGIELVANSWISRIYGPGVSLHLAPYSENKDGGIKDKIAMSIEGIGEGYGYKATSAGERRRVDVAMLFAVGTVSAAAQNMEPGTLWLDEVLDILDVHGAEVMCEIARELAQDRVVVVISHSDFIKSSLRPDHHWRINGGAVTVLH